MKQHFWVVFYDYVNTANYPNHVPVCHNKNKPVFVKHLACLCLKRCGFAFLPKITSPAQLWAQNPQRLEMKPDVISNEPHELAEYHKPRNSEVITLTPEVKVI